MPILDGNTPEEFEKALQWQKSFLIKARHILKFLQSMLGMNGTEGSYLEPDTVHGMKYLEAIKKVFA